jgi:hypothetical protein
MRPQSKYCPICSEPGRARWRGCCSGRCFAELSAIEAHDRGKRTCPELTKEELIVVYLADVDASLEAEASALIYRMAAKMRQQSHPEIAAAIEEGRWQPDVDAPLHNLPWDEPYANDDE